MYALSLSCMIPHWFISTGHGILYICDTCTMPIALRTDLVRILDNRNHHPMLCRKMEPWDVHATQASRWNAACEKMHTFYYNAIPLSREEATRSAFRYSLVDCWERTDHYVRLRDAWCSYVAVVGSLPGGTSIFSTLQTIDNEYRPRKV